MRRNVRYQPTPESRPVKQQVFARQYAPLFLLFHLLCYRSHFVQYVQQFRITYIVKGANLIEACPPKFGIQISAKNTVGAKRLGMVFFRNFEGIFEIARQRPLGNAEVRTNLFEKIPNPFGIFLLSVFFGLVGAERN